MIRATNTRDAGYMGVTVASLYTGLQEVTLIPCGVLSKLFLKKERKEERVGFLFHGLTHCVAPVCSRSILDSLPIYIHKESGQLNPEHLREPHHSLVYMAEEETILQITRNLKSESGL